MAIVANTFTSFDAKGIREELSDVINSISPETVPFQSNGKVLGTQTRRSSMKIGFPKC